jgi:AcrR family transcriptional regulator
MGRASAIRDYGGVSANDRRADRRRKLLVAGRTLWGSNGIGDVTVRGVCAEAGLVPRYFYEQFSDRDALILAVADQVRDELFAVLLDVGLNEPGEIADKICAGLKAFLDLIADDPHVHRIFSDVLVGGGPLAARRRQAVDMVTELVLEHGPGLLDFAPPSQSEMRRSATFIVGGLNQLIDAWMLDPRESTAELARAGTDLSIAIVRMHARTTPDGRKGRRN